MAEPAASPAVNLHEVEVDQPDSQVRFLKRGGAGIDISDPGEVRALHLAVKHVDFDLHGVSLAAEPWRRAVAPNPGTEPLRRTLVPSPAVNLLEVSLAGRRGPGRAGAGGASRGEVMDKGW